MRGHAISRRGFLKSSAAFSAAWAEPWGALASEPGFSGIFPIVQTPYTEAGKLDFQTLAREAKFLGRTGVHGIVWPQRASQYQYLTVAERLEGMEVLVAANKAPRPKLVLGVQGPDTATAVRYAQHAQRLRPNARSSLCRPAIKASSTSAKWRSEARQPAQCSGGQPFQIRIGEAYLRGM